MKFAQLIEDFKDIGKLSDDELKKGQSLKSTDDNNFTEVNGKVFHKAVTIIKGRDILKGDLAKGLKNLSVYTVSEYNKMKCYIGKNNSSGYALNKGDLVSVFSSQDSSADAIVQDAITNGAKHLDCYATREKNGSISGSLYRLYTRNGFKIDTTLNSGNIGEPYTIVNGISDYVNDNDEVEPENPTVVIFMKL